MDRLPFVAALVDSAPTANGIYVLYEGEELIYVGRAVGLYVTIRSRLKCHFRGDEGPCTQRATHYTWRICADGEQLERELLAAYNYQYGRLPRCNARIG
jgi:excinuclease UvrABC nuclease subunit